MNWRLTALAALTVIIFVVVRAGDDDEPLPSPITDDCTGSHYQYCPRGGCEALAEDRFPEIADLPVCGSVADDDPSIIRFAVVGDYGFPDDQQNCACHVAGLVRRIEKKWGLDFVLTVGDNNYYDGTWDTLYENIVKVYGRYIPSNHDDPAIPPRFFPTLGNHDWDEVWNAPGCIPYICFFDYLLRLSPGGGQQYRYPVPGGQVELFTVNSNLGRPGEPWSDPRRHADQIAWLRRALQSSTARWQIVYFHHSPYSTARAGTEAEWMRLRLAEWGADAVFTGDQHVYERIEHDGIPYVINGLGGIVQLYEIDGPACEPVPGSKARYNGAHGAVVGVASSRSLDLCLYSIEDGVTLVDSVSIPYRRTVE